MRTAPLPLSTRPTAAPANPSLQAVTSPPTTITARLPTSARRPPRRWPSSPPGSASATPGNR